VIKYETFIIKTFDQLKNDNFNQVNFGQVIIFHTIFDFLALRVFGSFFQKVAVYGNNS
jgi:hypothetical protein